MVAGKESGAEGPRHRLVALGASNVSVGFPQLVDAARGLAAGPVDVLAAMGHGRSYGRWSSIPGRALPGVTECGLWDALRRRPPLPTTALLTDIGNDLLYGVEPAALIGWVAECLTRLREVHARVSVAEIPLPAVTGLGPARYRLFRSIFFPGLGMSLSELTRYATATQRGVAQAASEAGARIAPVRPEWYGLDPIHIKPWRFRGAWSNMLGVQNAELPPHRLLPLRDRLALRWTRYDRVRVLGRQRRHTQPCLTARDGTRVSVF